MTLTGYSEPRGRRLWKKPEGKRRLSLYIYHAATSVRELQWRYGPLPNVLLLGAPCTRVNTVQKLYQLFSPVKFKINTLYTSISVGTAPFYSWADVDLISVSDPAKSNSSKIIQLSNYQFFWTVCPVLFYNSLEGSREPFFKTIFGPSTRLHFGLFPGFYISLFLDKFVSTSGNKSQITKISKQRCSQSPKKYGLCTLEQESNCISCSV